MDESGDRTECTCGSGGHPRRCVEHPQGFDLHVMELNYIGAQEEVADLTRQLFALQQQSHRDQMTRHLVEQENIALTNSNEVKDQQLASLEQQVLARDERMVELEKIALQVCDYQDAELKYEERIEALEQQVRELTARLAYVQSHHTARFVVDQQNRIRALETALGSVVTIAKEARLAWDADKDMRVGKILIALSGKAPGYRADIDAIHALLKPVEESGKELNDVS